MLNLIELEHRQTRTIATQKKSEKTKEEQAQHSKGHKMSVKTLRFNKI